MRGEEQGGPAADAVRLLGHGVRHGQLALPAELITLRRLPPTSPPPPSRRGRFHSSRSARKEVGHSLAVDSPIDGIDVTNGGILRADAKIVRNRASVSCLWGDQAVGRPASPIAYCNERNLFSDHSRVVNICHRKQCQCSGEGDGDQRTAKDATTSPRCTGEKSRLVIIIFSTGCRGGIVFFIIVKSAIFFRSDIRISSRFAEPATKPEDNKYNQIVAPMIIVLSNETL